MGHTGIGRATAVALSNAGWSTVLFARRLEQLNETKAQCKDPEQCSVIEGDVTKEEDVRHLFQRALERFGQFPQCFSR